MMTFELYKEVALTTDIPEHRLKKGDVATIADKIEPRPNHEPAYVLEVFSAIGETVDVLIVQESQIEPLQADELFQIRHFAAAA
jgi:Domain of unknown function (DUF4926)